MAKILLIEDEVLSVKMYRTYLKTEGHQVMSADNGEKGLKMVSEFQPDLIVLDIMMPKISGLDLLTQLRQDPKGKNIPVIVLSNLAEEEKMKKAISLGAKEFLIKANVTPGDVVARVKQHLGSKAQTVTSKPPTLGTQTSKT